MRLLLVIRLHATEGATFNATPNWGVKNSAHFEGLHDQRGPGPDLRGEPIEVRKATLASLLRGSLPGLRLNRAAKGTHVRKCKCGKAPSRAPASLTLTLRLK